MTETAKTMLMVGAAALSLLVAFAMGPADHSQNLEALVGDHLNQFEIDVAKRLKIVKFDRETASTQEFEVAEEDGLWSIPSKQGYPADAAKQMAEAATCLIDREVLRVAGKNANSHEELGVIDPNTAKLDSKAEGVGTRVTITDTNDTALADMIIGKPVKDAQGQYYVRNANQDVVMVVNLDPEKLSTKFEDWIEHDLLELSPMDISKVNIKDYSAELQPVLTASGLSFQVNWARRGEFSLTYDSEQSKWTPELLQRFDPTEKSLVAYQLAEDETLNEQTLNDLRSGLDELLLVDVERKPAGLSSDLKAGGNFLENQDAARDLMERGFAPLPIKPGGPKEILSTEGEIICTLKDGVEYVLRFGNLQIGKEDDSETPAQAAADGSADEPNATADDGINRYLFVMARFNESMIEKPTLKELPALPPSDPNEADAEESKTEQAEQDKAEKNKTDSEKDETAEKDQPTENTPESPAKDRDTDTQKDDEESKQLQALIAQREDIEKENQRAQDEHQEQIKAGQDRVKQLNERFGDWYYLISNDVYNKIHLSRKQVIAKKKDEDKKSTANPGFPAGGIPGLPNLPIGGGQ